MESVDQPTDRTVSGVCISIWFEEVFQRDTWFTLEEQFAGLIANSTSTVDVCFPRRNYIVEKRVIANGVVTYR